MFTSFDEAAFKQAIKDKDYLALKVNTISAILNDPTFARGELEEILKILKEQVPEIFEPYTRLSYEEQLEQNAWDKRYFSKLTYWFQDNFSEERLAHIKEVGRAVHQDTAAAYAASLSLQNKAEEKSMPQKKAAPTPNTKRVSPQAKKNPTALNTSQHKKGTGNFPNAGVILAVIALVFVGILLLKFILK